MPRNSPPIVTSKLRVAEKASGRAGAVLSAGKRGIDEGAGGREQQHDEIRLASHTDDAGV